MKTVFSDATVAGVLVYITDILSFFVKQFLFAQ